jgi:hypothetical protein
MFAKMILKVVAAAATVAAGVTVGQVWKEHMRKSKLRKGDLSKAQNLDELETAFVQNIKDVATEAEFAHFTETHKSAAELIKAYEDEQEALGEYEAYVQGQLVAA